MFYLRFSAAIQATNDLRTPIKLHNILFVLIHVRCFNLYHCLLIIIYIYLLIVCIYIMVFFTITNINYTIFSIGTITQFRF